MITKKGFLLLELISALFLLTLCVALSISQSGHINALAVYSLQTYKRLCLAQDALEKARLSSRESFDRQTVDGYTLETTIKKDLTLKNFLHIEVTVYDKTENIDTWFSGVVLPYEA
jgi:hypothetical protein